MYTLKVNESPEPKKCHWCRLIIIAVVLHVIRFNFLLESSRYSACNVCVLHGSIRISMKNTFNDPKTILFFKIVPFDSLILRPIVLPLIQCLPEDSQHKGHQNGHFFR